MIIIIVKNEILLHVFVGFITVKKEAAQELRIGCINQI